MKKWRYVVLSGAALSWGGCADLPSFPEGLYNTTGGSGGTGTTSSSGSGTVIPNAGTGTTTAGTGSTAGGSGSETAGTGSTTGGASGAATTAGTDSGGTPGTAGTASGGTAGTGGAMANPQAEIDDAVKTLKGWRYENPCGAVDGHTLTDGQCNSGEICWPDGNKAHFAEKKVIQIGGVAGHQYDVTLRIRGAIEPRDYPSNCTFIPGGQDGKTISIIENCDGFANTGQVQFNVYQFAIENPKHVYYLNAVKLHPPHRVDSMDQTWTIRVAGGTKINFDFDDINGGEIRNCSVTIPGIQPYPKSYDGNFYQLDVVDAKLVP
jgi:hypothetical protein